MTHLSQEEEEALELNISSVSKNDDSSAISKICRMLIGRGEIRYLFFELTNVFLGMIFSHAAKATNNNPLK